MTAAKAVHAGVDGEAMDLSSPLRFVIRPRALRVPDLPAPPRDVAIGAPSRSTSREASRHAS